MFYYSSNLKNTEEGTVPDSLLAREEFLYPTLLLSLIFNLLTGGFLFKLFTPILPDFTGTKIKHFILNFKSLTFINTLSDLKVLS